MVTQVNSSGTGNAGNLKIETGELIIRGGAQISSGTFGNGNGGNLTIHAEESVVLKDVSTNGRLNILATQVNSLGTGNAGDLTIETARLILQDGAFVSSATFGKGNGGNLHIRATESVELMGLNSFGFGSQLVTGIRPQAIGDAGNISIETGQLLLNDGAGIV
ncbi:MAG: hypothetical protein F6K36_27255 [Symploca sp. SIO3C6]|nr:hypothetical protein [Symploca sp. SIO3C6]